ncbi:hypothetical protein [Streptomyces daliensis]|uniref:Uncharacterized protein n=1 Tax=Streptomyces daliensis TaxID=299421 RepID=A0A8T4IVU9_9ACTN|nr:hypothetical protein [Streptomyces daliensis]
MYAQGNPGTQSSQPGDPAVVLAELLRAHQEDPPIFRALVRQWRAEGRCTPHSGNSRADPGEDPSPVPAPAPAPVTGTEPGAPVPAPRTEPGKGPGTGPGS